MKGSGICYLVGAGPGDPGLATVKCRDCIAEADVLVYDALSSPKLLTWAKPDCEFVYVGKRAKNHAMPQDEINALIVRETEAGKVVVRLKGGDPMIFGRGGEEAAELAEAGVPFEIVPGISSTIAGPAYAGVPVTHRDHCSQLTLFTGHEDPTKNESSIDYAHLAKTPGTRVFVMGVSRMRAITTALIDGGESPDTPMSLTRWATTGRHKTLVGTVATIADLVEENDFKSPAVAVIGDVVKEREKINWFETKPLFSKRIVVTRTREQAGALSRQLEKKGADVLELPTISIELPDDKVEFAQMVTDVHTYDWVIFTSPNGVSKFFDAFYSSYADARSFGGARIAAVGPSTAAKLKEYRFATDLLPENYVAEGLVDAFKDESIENQTMLWVHGAEARPVVFDGLTALGAIVDECIAYETVPLTEDKLGVQQQIKEEGADVITFTSASTVENFFALGLPWPEGCVAASIGPVTTAALVVNGKPPEIEAIEATMPSLVEAIEAYFGNLKKLD